MRRLLVVLALCVPAVLAQTAQAVAAPGPRDAPEYWFDQWQLTSLWQDGVRGQHITIAEIDTGVNAELPELAGKVLPGKDFGPSGGDGRTDRSVDPFGHGTAMASIMVARQGYAGVTGIAPDAKLLPVAVPIGGTGATNSLDTLPQAIRWAADHGGKIINMSLGGKRRPGGGVLPCPSAEQDAILYAIAKGAIVVVSAGNSGDLGSPVEHPSVCLGVVSVGAVDRFATVSDFSSRHRYLTVSAPGVDVASLGQEAGTAYSGSGTSQAAAITSAVLALVWSKHPRQTNRQIVTRLLATLDHRSAVRSTSYGFGIVNARTAVTAAVAASAANPVFTAIDPFLAKAPVLSAPAKARVSGSPAGAFEVGNRPGRVGDRLRSGAGVALAGGLLIALLLVRRLRWRRRNPTVVGPMRWPDPVETIWDTPR